TLESGTSAWANATRPALLVLSPCAAIGCLPRPSFITKMRSSFLPRERWTKAAILSDLSLPATTPELPEHSAARLHQHARTEEPGAGTRLAGPGQEFSWPLFAVKGNDTDEYGNYNELDDADERRRRSGLRRRRAPTTPACCGKMCNSCPCASCSKRYPGLHMISFGIRCNTGVATGYFRSLYNDSELDSHPVSMGPTRTISQ
uniref:Epidermal patterning factor-like protein n=1 Tax=Macrostomum lignano TaxID=282301 RepID=A0A1I8FMC3_9PLAT